jgi:hypothetical protein
MWSTNISEVGGLTAARNILRERGLQLVLGLVRTWRPTTSVFNHQVLYQNADDLRRDPASFFEAGGKVFAAARTLLSGLA